MVVPGLALAHHPEAGVAVDVTDIPPSDVTAEETAAVVEAAEAVTRTMVPAVPAPRVDEPEIMPLPARVVLGFADGSTQMITPLSDEAERMCRTADRLLGTPTER